MTTALAAPTASAPAPLQVDAVLDVVLATALRLFEGDHGSIMLRVDVDELEVVASPANPQALRARVRFGDGVAGKVAATGDGVLVSGRGGGRSRPVDSSMCVPLFDGGHLFGVLNVNAGPVRRFTDFDLVACTRFAAHAAEALSAARRYEAARSGGALVEPHLVELVRAVEAAASVDFVEPDPNGEADVAAIARSVGSAGGSTGRGSVDVDGPGSAPVRGRSRDVRRLLQELVENAHRHGGGVARVRIEADDRLVVVTVVDDGPGIPAADRSCVLGPYGRLERRTDGDGIGLGFTIAERLATALGGTLELVDRQDGGAAVEVRLPAV